MNKELEAFKNIRREAGIPYFSTLYDIDMWKDDLSIVENALKGKEKQDEIFRIIKEKRVNFTALYSSKKLETYNWCMTPKEQLTQTEFDLLKEVLCSKN